MSRLKLAAKIINSQWTDVSVLDVGCRGKELKPLLNNVNQYQGLDLKESHEVLAHDLEKAIPLDDNSFDIVTALDVVEHVDQAHQLMSELLRVSKKAVIVSLPNMYYWEFRLKFFFGIVIGGKYIFPPSPIKDRHRWLPSYISSEEFIRGNAGTASVEIIPVLVKRRRNKLMNVVEVIGVKISPNLFAYGGMYILRK